MNYHHQIGRVLILFMLFLVLLSSVSLGKSGLTVEQIGTRKYAGEGYMEVMGPLVFMHLKGSPYEIGLQHGTLLAHLVPDESLIEMGGQFNPLTAQVSGVNRLIQGFQQFYFRYKINPWIDRNIPEDVYKELEGIIYGVSQGQESAPLEIIMGNVSQDLGMTFACTSMAAFGEATASGSLYHARNLDHIGMIDWAEHGFVVIYEPDQGYPFITHIYPIHAGTMQAMNNQGITVSVNYSLVDRSDNSLDGMAMVFLIRQIVQYASTLDEAIEIVLNTPRTFGLNILISDSKVPDAVVLEVDPNRYAIRRGNDQVLYTANRYNSEYMQQFQTPGWLASARRENRLSQFFADNHGKVTVESLVNLLRDRNEPGSVGYDGLVDGINNAGSLLSCVFSPNEQMMWISIIDDQRGSPDTELYAFSLSRALAGDEPAVFSRNIPATQEEQNFVNWLLVRKATIAYSKNQLAVALEYLSQIDLEFSEAEAVLNLKAHIYFRLGNNTQAMHYFQILADCPQVAEPFYHLEAHAILGAFNDSAGNREAALASYEKALQITIPDLGGNTTFYQRLAEAGLQRPIYIESTKSGYYFTNKDSAIVEFLRAPKAIPIKDLLSDSKYDGRQIANVRILGVHNTDKEILARIIQLQPGTTFSAAQFQAGKRRLNALQAFEPVQMYVVPASETHVDIVVRISEGFGLYLDPVEFVIETIVNLRQKSVSMRYYSVGGTLASIGGEYGFGTNNRRVASLTFPLYAWPTTIRYQSQTNKTKLVWGDHIGSEYTLDRADLSVSTQVPLGHRSTVALTAGYFKSDVSSLSTATGLVVTSKEYFNLASTIQTGVPGSTTWTQRGTTAQIGASILGNAKDLTEYYPRLRLQARNVSYLGGGFTSRLELDAAWTQSNTPFEWRYRLGGNGQLGTSDSMFVGEMYVYSNFEVQRYFTHHLAAHFNFEAAKIWENEANRELSSLLYSVGGGMTYKTPVGIDVRAQYSRNLTLADMHSVTIGIVNRF